MCVSQSREAGKEVDASPSTAFFFLMFTFLIAQINGTSSSPLCSLALEQNGDYTQKLPSVRSPSRDKGWLSLATESESES